MMWLNVQAVLSVQPLALLQKMVWIEVLVLLNGKTNLSSFLSFRTIDTDPKISFSNHSFYLQASTSTSIMTCAPCAVGAGSGYLNQVTSCSPCREGALSCVTSPKARDLSCDTNLFLNKAHRCTACAPGTGTAYDNDDRRCRRCPMGATKCLFEVTAIDCLPGFNLIAASSGLSVCSLDSNTASVISVQ